MTAFPQLRLRRLRRSETVREMVRETSLAPSDLIYPLFVCHGREVKTPIESMPGCYQLSLDQLLTEVTEIADLGISGVMLFGLPASKDEAGTEAYDPQGIVQEAVKMIKQTAPRLFVITDVCLCEYTDHGHCGIIGGDGTVDNDKTLELLARSALSHADAGADMVAPSAMMDGQVNAIRTALDQNGPFRDTNTGLRGQVRLCLLRPIPRSGWLHAAVWGQAGLPDGPGKRPHGAARNRAGYQ